MRCAISASIQHFMHFIKRKNCILTSRVAHFIIDVGCGAPATHRRFYFVPLYATLAICTWICLTRRRARALFRKNKKFLFVCHDALRWIEIRCDYFFFLLFRNFASKQEIKVKRGERERSFTVIRLRKALSRAISMPTWHNEAEYAPVFTFARNSEWEIFVYFILIMASPSFTSLLSALLNNFF